MMIFRQLTGIGDWTFGKGIYSYATQNNAIALDIQTALLSWKGNCFWSLGDFVDWIARLDYNQEANLNTELQAVILARTGVVRINSFTMSLDPNTRKFSATYNIDTIYSTNVQNTIALAAGVPQGS
jgi:hypothetical protein